MLVGFSKVFLDNMLGGYAGLRWGRFRFIWYFIEQRSKGEEMKKLLFLFAVVVCCTCLTSCATLFDDDTSGIVINSDPAGAVVKVDGYPMGKTPVALNLDSGTSHTVEISKEGYRSEFVTLKKSVKWGWQVLDVVTTGFVGNIVDLVSPNGYKLKPEKVFVSLTEENQPTL